MLIAQFIEPELSLLQTTLLTVWLAAIGASVGSFLNVVVYRAPAGLSIAHPPSHCPTCQHFIRRRDNIPIYSWIALGGKCHYCTTPIAPRYVLVECFVALTFAILAVIEGTSNGMNLPGNEGIFSSFRPAIWMIYANHVILLSTLWCMALIELDGNRVPPSLAVPCLVAAAALMLCSESIYPKQVGFDGPAGWRLNNLLTGFIGASISFVVAWLLRETIRATRSSAINGNGWIMSAILCGWVLGWQAALLILASTTALLIAGITTRELSGASLSVTSDQPTSPTLRGPWLPPISWMLLVTLGTILTWKHWVSWFPG